MQVKRQNADDDDNDYDKDVATSIKDEDLGDGVRSYTSNIYGTFVVFDRDRLCLKRKISFKDEENNDTSLSLLSQHNDNNYQKTDNKDSSNKHNLINEGEKITRKIIFFLHSSNNNRNVYKMKYYEQRNNNNNRFINGDQAMSMALAETKITELSPRLEYSQSLNGITFEHSLA